MNPLIATQLRRGAAYVRQDAESTARRVSAAYGVDAPPAADMVLLILVEALLPSVVVEGETAEQGRTRLELLVGQLRTAVETRLNGGR